MKLFRYLWPAFIGLIIGISLSVFIQFGLNSYPNKLPHYREVGITLFAAVTPICAGVALSVLLYANYPEQENQ